MRRRLLVHPRLEPEGGCRLPLRGRIGLLAGNKTRYKDPIAAIADGVDLGFIGSLVASAVYLLLPRRTMSESADRSRADSCFVPECESRPRLAPYER
jgi:hypothetical protein